MTEPTNTRRPRPDVAGIAEQIVAGLAIWGAEDALLILTEARARVYRGLLPAENARRGHIGRLAVEGRRKGKA